MTAFWFVLIITMIIDYIAQARSVLVYNNSTKTEEYKPNKFLYALTVIIMIVIAGLREGVGDTGAYRRIFSTIPSNVIQYLQSDVISEDRGFYFIVALIKQFISSDNQVIIFVLSLLTIGMMCYGLYKYGDNIFMLTFLFIATGCYGTSMNGVRQYLAAAILFLAIPLIQKRKFIPYVIIVLLAYTIHGSSIIFLPLYFLNRCKGWGVVSYLLILGGIILYVTYSVTGPVIADILNETQYGNYTDALLSDDQGANMLRCAVYAVPLVFSFMKKDLINKNMKYGNLMINMSILNFIFMLLANRYWIYARFCIYFNLYEIILLTYCMDNIFETKSARIITILCIILYIIFFWYDALMNGLSYSSLYLPF